jgi:hypothetical protein
MELDHCGRVVEDGRMWQNCARGGQEGEVVRDESQSLWIEFLRSKWWGNPVDCVNWDVGLGIFTDTASREDGEALGVEDQGEEVEKGRSGGSFGFSDLGMEGGEHVIGVRFSLFPWLLPFPAMGDSVADEWVHDGARARV